MDLQIKVLKTGIEDKPLFRATVLDICTDFEFDALIKAFRAVYGAKCCIEFFIV